jgi:hypothetical protein
MANSTTNESNRLATVEEIRELLRPKQDWNALIEAIAWFGICVMIVVLSTIFKA